MSAAAGAPEVNPASDVAKPVPPGQEKAHAGNVAGSVVRPAGGELSTVKNGDLANAGNAGKAF